jgi:prepilin-type N-terminal cleavage/methylation domain-containing protein
MKRFDHQHSHWSEQGFTLLEIIIAVTLMVLIAAGLWGVLSISIRGWAKGAQYIDANQRNRSAMTMVRKQIASAYNLIVQPDPTIGGIPYPFFNGTESGFQFVSVNSLLFQDSPGMTLVTYEISEGINGDYSLVEKEARYIGQNPDQESLPTQEKITSVLDNISSCSLEYYDPGNTENPAQWVKEWSGKDSGRLPAAVSMDMNWRDSRGNTVNRQIVIPIQASVATNTRIGIRGIQ